MPVIESLNKPSQAEERPYFEMFTEHFVKANEQTRDLLLALQAKVNNMLLIETRVEELTDAFKNNDMKIEKRGLPDFSSTLREQLEMLDDHNKMLSTILKHVGRMV